MLCTTAYALSDKQSIEVDADLESATINISGKIDPKTAFHEATMTLIKPGIEIAELGGLSEDDSFTDIIAAYYQTTINTDGEYQFDDFKIKNNGGWYTVVITSDNGVRYNERKFLPDQNWIDTLKSEMSVNMYQALETHKEELKDITEIDIYYSFDSATKNTLLDNVVIDVADINLENVIKQITKLSIERDIVTTSSKQILKQYLFPEESDISAEYAMLIKDVFDISDSSNISTIKHFLDLNSGDKASVIEKASTISKRNLADVINALNISVIEYRIGKVGNWAEIFGIIESHKDTLQSLNFEGYKASDRRSDIDKSLMTKTFTGTEALCNYINTEVSKTTSSESGFGGGSSGGGSSGGGMVSSGGSSSGGGSGGNSSESGNVLSDGSQGNKDNGEQKSEDVFKDISNHSWAKEAIEYLYNKGIVAGTGEGNFSPNDAVTREAFVKMIVTAANIKAEGPCNFEDVSEGAWYYQSVVAAVNAGIVNGYSERIFGVGENIKREDMAVILAGLINSDINREGRREFTDSNEIAEYAKESVSKVSALGIINGFDDNTFAPKSFCTRAQAAVVIYNLIKVGGYNG